MKIRSTPPEPELVVDIEHGIYAWKCECEHLKAWGNSAEKAIQAWKDAKQFEEEL